MVGIIMLLAKCFYAELNFLQKKVVDNCLMWFYHCYVSLAYIHCIFCCINVDLWYEQYCVSTTVYRQYER